ncbi:Diaminopimelate epimerase-like protein [Lophiostoma macrostomum CBS 122681]|uniref:Diaminopimelate epimerase-like protein n=1 Tax=Lophiostoma macrostomum CBS 122681 TaxID=1314788 RepID=A0A6A6TGL9_9PLEO|nr:Diaminopimelate epimerase-like protein [Lophiostoma macrostomum CBS 122681]
MQLPYTTLDIFTNTRYTGNPLAIVRVPSNLRPHLTEAQKLAIAAEINLSETVFLHDVKDGEDWADYDIFTPRARMSFAGHPTIGTALYLSTLHKSNDHAFTGIRKIKTVAGLVPFDFWPPSTSTSLGTASVAIPHDVHIHAHRLPHPNPTSGLKAAAGEEADRTVPLVSIVKGMAFNLVPFHDLDALGAVTSGLLPVDEVFRGAYLDRGSGWDVGYMGTFYYVDLGWEDIDGDRRVVRTRSIGTREDPGTGSASCALCCYLALVQGKEGEEKVEFHLTQGVEMGRRCDIFVSVVRTEDGKGIQEVRLRGEAVKVMEGVLSVGED